MRLRYSQNCPNDIDCPLSRMANRSGEEAAISARRAGVESIEGVGVRIR